jgi:two-component system chemotaxis response regulator CheB
VLLVDDSALTLAVLKRILSASPDIQVVGTAANGREALNLIPQLQPTVVCTDFHMPEMDGLQLTREIMVRFPRPILVVSSAVGPADTERVFSLLEAGAIDVFPKPRGGLGSDPAAAEQLISKIKIVAGVFVFPRRAREAPAPAATGVPAPSPRPKTRARLVAIGASTGGPQALQTVLSPLPGDYAVPVLCVQHISRGFLHGLVEWLGAQCRLRVKVAEPGETAQPGTVYFPAEGTHLVIDDRGRLSASREDPVDGHRPSVSITFRSVARHYSRAAVAVLLTGMGKDGADGMQSVAQAGGMTIAQDEASCVVFGMPRHAIELGSAQHVLPPPDIARLLLDLVR